MKRSAWTGRYDIRITYDNAKMTRQYTAETWSLKDGALWLTEAVRQPYGNPNDPSPELVIIPFPGAEIEIIPPVED